MCTVSVVIPTHNRAARLQRALDSVFSQTRPPDQVFVVDDGSTDETAAVVEASAAHYIYQRQAGVSAARNRGIAAARGRWIALLDDDDEWLPTKLERQLAALARAPEHRLCHTDEIWIRRGRRVNPRRKHRKYGGRIFRRCLPLCAISPSAVLLRRDMLDEVGLFDPALPACEDYDLWLRICAREPVLLVAEPLVVKHGGHADQLSRRHWGMDRFRVRALERVLGEVPLADNDRTAALATLRAKLEILRDGARKRGKALAAAEYQRKLQRWSDR